MRSWSLANGFEGREDGCCAGGCAVGVGEDLASWPDLFSTLCCGFCWAETAAKHSNRKENVRTSGREKEFLDIVTPFKLPFKREKLNLENFALGRQQQ